VQSDLAESQLGRAEVGLANQRVAIAACVIVRRSSDVTAGRRQLPSASRRLSNFPR